MSDDASKYFPDAGALLARYQASAVFVLVLDGVRGSGGCPAFNIPNGPDGQPDKAVLSRQARAVMNMMRFIASDLEKRFVLPGDRAS
jgi:hypothetical protein